jgi:hypothetical protein
MNAYQIMIEGVFAIVPATDGKDVHGFHSTFYLEAINASNALQRVAPLLRERMRVHGVKEVNVGSFKTYCWVHDIWEISDDKLSQAAGEDFGFTFFRVGGFERFYLFLRRLFFEKFRPWVLVPKSNETASA